jgi:hypothetical protein
MSDEKVLVAPPDSLESPTGVPLEPAPTRDVLSRRINAEPEEVEKGLAQLVLTIVELLRQLMERQALRRVEAGGLSDEQIERLGQALMLHVRSDMPITQAHDRYIRVLLDHIAADRYPSGELMDRVEILLDREHIDGYLELLFQKVESDRYPSKELLDRIARWTLSGS